MQAAASFKLAFLRHMLARLRLSGVSSTNMGVLERKRAIKHAADLAMAAARGGRARWSRALLAGAPGKETHKALGGMQGRRRSEYCRISSSKKILRRSCRARRKCTAVPRRAASASLLARRMVKKRTQVLRQLVPGGDSMDGFSLLEETLDYMVSLRAQVELMRRLADALGLAHRSGSDDHPASNPQEEKNS